MKAMIFAAGYGTRLKPLTDKIPKALVEVNGITLLEHAVTKLSKAGIHDILINVCHFSDQIIAFLHSKNNFGINIEVSDESDNILDTGGGLMKARWFFDRQKSFILYNVDVLTDIDLYVFFQQHIQSNALVTLAVRNRESTRYFLFNKEMRLCGWKGNNQEKIIRKDAELSKFAFSGIHAVSPKIFDQVNKTGKFSLTELYLELGVYNPIAGYVHDQDYWVDVGKAGSIELAEKMLTLYSSGNE